MSKWDESHFALRFSPRLARSNWSAVNIARFAELRAEGRVQPPGLAAFERRDLHKSEERPADLPSTALKRFPKDAKSFWLAQPPGYRRQASGWVLSAKQEATRERRLLLLIEDCAAGRRVKVVPG